MWKDNILRRGKKFELQRKLALFRKYKRQEIAYLNNKLESASYVSIAADNDHYVDIADSHIKERATTNLPHRTGTQLFRLHYVHTKGIHHIPPDTTPPMNCKINW